MSDAGPSEGTNFGGTLLANLEMFWEASDYNCIDFWKFSDQAHHIHLTSFTGPVMTHDFISLHEKLAFPRILILRYFCCDILGRTFDGLHGESFRISGCRKTKDTVLILSQNMYYS